MTATIAPPPGAVARSDLAQRLVDYLAALKSYLSLPSETVDRVVFVDNSAGDMAPFEPLARRVTYDKTVEVITFAGNDHLIHYGKAYGEFKLIDYRFATSRLARADDVFWKETGRLRLTNLAEIAATLPLPFDLECSMQGYRGLFDGLWRERTSGFDAGFFCGVVTSDFDGTYRIVPRFPVRPRFASASDRHDRQYDPGLQALKTDVRAVMHRALPRLSLYAVRRLPVAGASRRLALMAGRRVCLGSRPDARGRCAPLAPISSAGTTIGRATTAGSSGSSTSLAAPRISR